MYTPPEWAVALLASMSGYVQSAHPELVLPLASRTAYTFDSGYESETTLCPELYSLALMCGLIRCYGCAEPAVSLAPLGLLRDCTDVLADDDPARWAAVGEQADLIVADASRMTAQSATSFPSSPARPRCGGGWHDISPSSSALRSSAQEPTGEAVAATAQQFRSP